MSFLVVPAAVLAAGAFLLWLMNRGKTHVGSSWFTAILAAVFVWGWTLWQHWRPSSAFRIGQTASPTGMDFPIIFTLDSISWPYMMTLAALLLILLLTEPSRMDPKTAPRIWTLYLVIELVAYIAVTSDGVWPFIFCWMFFDIVDAISQYDQNGVHRPDAAFIISIAFRLTGTLLAATSLAMSALPTAQSASGMISTSTEFISEAGGVVLLIACSLRLGLIPIHQPYAQMDEAHIGLGSMLRLASILTVLPILSRIPLALLAPQLAVFLSLFVGFAALVGASGWLLAKDIPSGSNYAVMAITGMAFACALRSQQHALIVWGISIVLTCMPIFLYQAHHKLVHILLLISLLLFSGLPYMPNAIGWFGLIIAPFSAMDLLFIIVPMLVMAGAFIHLHRQRGKKLTTVDPWMRSVYPLGFLFTIATHLLVCMLNWEYSYSLGIWQASTAAFAGALLIWLFVIQIGVDARAAGLAAWVQAGIELFWRITRRLLALDWLFSVLKQVYFLLRGIAYFITNILESRGGLIWELLILCVFAFLIFSTGSAA